MKKTDKIDIRLWPSKCWSRAIMRLLLYDGPLAMVLAAMAVSSATWCWRRDLAAYAQPIHHGYGVNKRR
jgi:hypothetical protein